MLRLIARFFGVKYSEEEQSYCDATWKAIEDLMPEDFKEPLIY